MLSEEQLIFLGVTHLGQRVLLRNYCKTKKGNERKPNLSLSVYLAYLQRKIKLPKKPGNCFKGQAQRL